jgi:hypothetical protein
MTKGVKSSEFFLAVATVVCTLLTQFVGIDLDPVSLSGMIGTVMAYIVSRGMAKTENK